MNHEMTIFVFHIAGYVAAQKDAWFIGDSFLLEVHSSLQSLKDGAKDSKRPLPYVYEYYNMSFFMESPSSTNVDVLAHFHNSIVHALSTAK